MVQIASPSGYYDLPIFNLAKGLATRLARSDQESSAHLNKVQDQLRHMDFKGRYFNTVRGVPMGALDIQALAAMPRILQDIYDHPLPLEKPALRFYAALVLEHLDGTSRTLFMDDQTIDDDQKKKEYAEALRDPKLSSVLPFMLVASPDKTIDIPLQRMLRSLERAKRMMFDHSRYRYGEHRLVDESYVGFARQHDPREAADRLLPAVDDAYGRRLMMAEQPGGGVISIVPENAFQHMEQEEMRRRNNIEGRMGL